MVQSCDIAGKNPVKAIDDALEDLRELAQDVLNYQLVQLNKADKELKAVLEGEGGKLPTLYQERARLRERHEALVNATECSDDDVSDTIEQFEELELNSRDASANAQVAAEIAEIESAIPGLQSNLAETEEELENLKSVRDLTEELLGLKIKTETKDADQQIVRFTFTKIVKADPKREFALRLMLRNSMFTGVSTDPPLPHTPELQQRLEDAKADRHQLKALIRYVRHEFSCKYKSEGTLSQSATVIA